jgi:hypothetical protein
MENRPSLDKLRSELARRGLPRAYIERLLSELDDHCTDLLQERSTTMGAARKLQVESDDLQQRLGDPTQLAIFAAEQYHARSFWGRHPLVTYLIAPLPLFAVCWLAFGVTVGLFVNAIQYGVNALGWTEWVTANLGNDHFYLQATMIAFLCWYITVLPPLTAAWMLCRTCRRNVLDWRWPVLGCALLAVAASIFTATFHIMTDTNKSAFSMGFEVRTSTDWLFFLLRFACAFGIGLLLIKRAQRQLQFEM